MSSYAKSLWTDSYPSIALQNTLNMEWINSVALEQKFGKSLILKHEGVKHYWIQELYLLRIFLWMNYIKFILLLNIFRYICKIYI